MVQGKTFTVLITPFNRTSLELKPFISARCENAPRGAFNRTSLELKLRCEWLRLFRDRLLIEPVWN